jgi:hypothetical protein
VTYDLQLVRVLAHSMVFFSREEWLPVADARCDGKDTSSADQTTQQQQVGGQGGGAGSRTNVAGAGATNSGNEGTILSGSAASGNKGTINLLSSDPEVTEAALGGAETVSVSAIDANSAVASSAIAAGVAATQANAAFGEDALSFAANAQADATTTVEGVAEQVAAGEETTANNALAAAQNETLAGVTPAQQFQEYGTTTSGSTVSSIATWLTVIVAVVTIAYFIKKGKTP